MRQPDGPPLITLRIRHTTTYRYRQPVFLGQHRLILRPRESCGLSLISSDLEMTPAGLVTWAHDVFGNAVATSSLQVMTDHLVIDSRSEVRLEAVAWPVFDIAASAIYYPFLYSDDEWTGLGALAVKQYPDRSGRLANWTRGFVRSARTNTLSLLKDLSAGVSNAIRYQSRHDEGTQLSNDIRNWSGPIASPNDVTERDARGAVLAADHQPRLVGAPCLRIRWVVRRLWSGVPRVA